MRFAVIGAGFYGLHIATRLKALGLEIRVFEKSDDILTFASGNNQFRLHLGFHYARNFRTRQQSRDGFFRFLERYQQLTEPIPENYYLVPKGDSLIDFSTYKLIMMSSGLDFVEKEHPVEISYPCGSVVTAERVLMIDRARQHFYQHLPDTIELGVEATVSMDDDRVRVNGESFDYCIDCTWGHLMPDKNFFFESTILLYYRKKEAGSLARAYTFVDGPLCSLYPTEKPGIFTLSSVPYTPIAQHGTSDEALHAIATLSSHDINLKRLLMEKQIMRYYPGFLDDYEYLDPQLCVKTKPFGHDDDRSCYVKRYGRLIKCLSGKVDNIFYAAAEVMALIEDETE
ncbi:NAD(P)/FAD-dependent oxidoreductase [Synechococcus sp. RSCCF101]|uniref:FAD-dependent oxidoreductase n=1 Tax=Synechococcus sp. RSCCF101 TaxID=2511069 RepID=UPI0012487C3E|nr:FAD-dependent oxidoreductase [Synechococcus sp. RSCCF101]QEY32366.1 NAD(P)/FAD-dependent oxidoreductase [Synechococcus sp. RSCCF101]